MCNRKIKYFILGAFAVLAVILFFVIWHAKNVPLQVVFLDVGQGDAILISEGSQQLLVDGGKDGKLLLEKLGKHVPFWDRNIEAIIETHPDQDHIGGLINVLENYKVNLMLKTALQSDSQTFRKLEEKIGQLVDKKSIEVIEAKKGVMIKFTSGATAEIIYPLGVVTDVNDKDTNGRSVVVKLTVGKDKFLLAGDLPIAEEGNLIIGGADIQANFLKIAHHGSKYATSNEFLEAVTPTEAIISVGKNNSYGHPNQEVLQRLLQHKVGVFRTDEIGDIVYACQDLQSGCLRIVN